MKKVYQYILFIALLLGQAAAFTNGSAFGDQPWNGTPTAGALFVSYNYGTGGVVAGVNQKIQDTPTNPINVTTLKIYEVVVSRNQVAKNESVTLAFQVRNTGAETLNNISARPVFYMTTPLSIPPRVTGDALTETQGYAYTLISGPTSLAAGGTAWYVFRVTPGTSRIPGRIWVDGAVTFNAAQGLDTDNWWRNVNINSNEWQTGATTVNYLDSMPATLNLSEIQIISPNGAANNADKTLSAGQDFVISLFYRHQTSSSSNRRI